MTKALAGPNYTQIPNEMLDVWLAKLTKAELKVALYIARRTFGFHRDTVEMGMRRIAKGIPGKDNGTGLHLGTVSKAVETLETRGYIRCVSGVRGRKTYELNVSAEPNDCTEIPNTDCTEKPNSGPYGNSEHVERKSSSERKEPERKVKAASPASHHEVPKCSALKAKPETLRKDDDERPPQNQPPSSEAGKLGLLQQLRNAPRCSSDGEARERFRQLLALGKEQDPDNAILQIRKVLKEQDGSFIVFLEKALLTGNPLAVGGGHYTRIAQQMVKDSETRRMEQSLGFQRLRMAEKGDGYQHRCKDGNGACKDGKLPDDGFCTCSAGQLWRQLAEKTAQRMPPGSETATTVRTLAIA